MKKIVVVGGGTMGLDIAHTFARSGHAVVVREISDELAEKSHSRLVAALDKLVARGKMVDAVLVINDGTDINGAAFGAAFIYYIFHRNNLSSFLKDKNPLTEKQTINIRKD